MATRRAGGAVRGSRSFSQSASLACTCTSIPTRSTSSHGPIGQPAPCFMPASRSAGGAGPPPTPPPPASRSAGVPRASSSTRTQSFSSGIRIRLTTKPGVSWQRIGCLPSRSPSAYAVSNASSEVRSARTISTSGMRGAGLKKCIPTTRSGVEVAPAISVTESAEVFVASTASGRQTRSSSANSSRFGPRSSTIASITTSQSANAETLVVRVSMPRSKESIWLFSTLRVRKCSMRPRAASPSSSVTSRPTVSRPASPASCAMPAPMVPSPTTPTFTGLSLEHRVRHGRARDARLAVLPGARRGRGRPAAGTPPASCGRGAGFRRPAPAAPTAPADARRRAASRPADHPESGDTTPRPTLAAADSTRTRAAGLQPLDNGGDRLAEADAHRRQPVTRVAPLELRDKRGRDPRPGGPERVAERNAAAVRIHVSGVVALLQPRVREELAHDRGERLVDLDHGDVVPGQPRLGKSLRRCLRVAVQHQVRIDAHHAEGDELRPRLDPELPHLRLGGDEHGSRAVDDLGRVPRRHDAFRDEGRLELRPLLERRLAPHGLVDREADAGRRRGTPRRFGIRDVELNRHDLLVEAALVDGARGALVRLVRDPV